jgi:hypothetical protein
MSSGIIIDIIDRSDLIGQAFSFFIIEFFDQPEPIERDG